MPLAALWALAWATLDIGYWLALPLAAKIFGKDIKIGQLQVSTNPELGKNGIAALVNELAGKAAADATGCTRFWACPATSR